MNKKQVTKIDSNISLEEAKAILKIEDGADVYDYGLAGLLRGMERRGIWDLFEIGEPQTYKGDGTDHNIRDAAFTVGLDSDLCEGGGNMIPPESLFSYIEASIKILYNSNPKTFNKIFGEEMGPYLWDKFTIHFDASEGSFICYLDLERRDQFTKAVIKYAEEGEFR